MPYMQNMQGALQSLVSSGAAGQRSLDSMLGPMNTGTAQLTSSVSEISSLPFLSSGDSQSIQRVTRRIVQAQAMVGKVMNTYTQVNRVASGVAASYTALGGQVTAARNAVSKIIGKVNPSLASAISTSILNPTTSHAAAVKPFPHLLIMQPVVSGGTPFYFNLDTAAFDSLQRQTSYGWQGQERLGRRPAQQFVGMGTDKITLSGAIYPHFKGGLTQLDSLRTLAGTGKPYILTTGYGQVLGTWCLSSISEQQSALLHGGIPRKQGFTLEFDRYGDDLQNL
ncbi:phage tail protein [Frateuria aurantia]|uniref:Phage protein U n=1 Tax=Frateuria aurantia (strain ATCC 33424 / DSM 6220 / KCTC 2777 / LMG 1558 / NBRC 3245 / NCIMB 13370) TaxID=767434 RepID=H8L2K9_FRAAD|nr:phage tail protein [Frateuria aurantia]AFC85476.1 phage protein U [Frateuria aurantia DSM 6220]